MRRAGSKASSRPSRSSASSDACSRGTGTANQASSCFRWRCLITDTKLSTCQRPLWQGLVLRDRMRLFRTCSLAGGPYQGNMIRSCWSSAKSCGHAFACSAPPSLRLAGRQLHTRDSRRAGRPHVFEGGRQRARGPRVEGQEVGQVGGARPGGRGGRPQRLEHHAQLLDIRLPGPPRPPQQQLCTSGNATADVTACLMLDGLAI
jgi:hypothetical protein